jgi:Rad3-related DNA helicase
MQQRMKETEDQEPWKIHLPRHLAWRITYEMQLHLFQNNVVILDEAHNVEKICEESVSIHIRSTDVALCIQEITQVRNMPKSVWGKFLVIAHMQR